MRKPARRSTRSGGGAAAECAPPAKRLVPVAGVDVFDRLPDDLVIAVLAGVAARAAGPADLASAALACRRFRDVAAHPAVLSWASAAAVAVRAGAWSEAAHRFLRRCADAGSLHACYFLGMVRFYCVAGSSRASGLSLLARAAAGGHAAALYALAVVRFNGSGGDSVRDGKTDRDPRGGVALCARAAWLGSVPALRELGHCLQDGYGARRDPAAGRQLLLHAAARELLLSRRRRCGGDRCAEDDAASQFMVEWWALGGKAIGDGHGGDADVLLLLCTQARCGRRETRRHEFRRCSACGSASYCSRGCQALDWKRVHRGQCAAVRWPAAAAGGARR